MKTRIASMLLTLLLLISVLPASPANAAGTVVPIPGYSGKAASANYSMTVEGQAVEVKNEDYDFDVAMFSMSGTVTVNVTVSGSFTNYSLHPARHNIPVVRNGQVLSFTMSEPLKLVLKVDARKPLAILATPVETNVPSPGDPGVIYYGSGIHNAGLITLQSNQTLYLAPGALVKGRVAATNVNNVKIMGRGILDVSGYSVKADKTHGMIFDQSSDITVEGISLRSYGGWWQTLYLNSRDIFVNHFSQFGKGVNTDGVDIDGVQNFVVSNSFIRCEDDGLGWHSLDAVANGEPITENAVADNVVIWNTSYGNGVRIGASMETQMWRNITIKNTDILQHAGAGLYSDYSDWAWMENLKFENITIEKNTSPVTFKILKTQYSNSNGFLDERGHFDGLYFVNVKANGGTITLNGYDSDHRINNVYFNNTYVGSNPIDALSDIATNAYVTNVHFNQTIPTPDPVPSGHYEAEYLFSATNLKPQITYENANFSNGKGKMLKAGAINDYVDYRINVPATGSYNVRAGVKKSSVSGQFQLSVDGSNQGTASDLYASAEQFVELDLGNITFSTAGDKQFKFTVAGKHASSAGYELDIDYIKLTSAIPAPPAAPTLNSATAGDNQVALNWSSASGATGYKVKYGTASGNYTNTIDAGNVSSYSVAGLTNGTPYYFAVSAYNSYGESGNSNERSATPIASLFSDDFEDGNSNGWTIENGTWSVVLDGSQVFKQTSTGGEALVHAGTSTWADYSVQAKMKLYDNGANAASGIVARYVDSNNYYLLRLHQSGKVQLYKKVAGTFTLLNEAAISVGAGNSYTLKLTLNGSALTGYVDGVSLVSAVDSSLSSGMIGARSYKQTASFDDVTVN